MSETAYTRNAMLKQRRFFLSIVLVLGSLLASCVDVQDLTPVPGEIARINRRSITLTQLEAMQESSNMYWGLGTSLSIEQLRKAYGPALSELMAVELVKEQLEKKKLAVTAEELAAEEALIRDDYGEGAFEDMLISNAINLENWRFLLKNSLSVRKFREAIVRPGISISSKEVETLYREHQQEFYLSAKEHFILLAGQSADAVERAAAQLLSSADEVQVQADHPEVQVSTVRMPRERLSPDLHEAISNLIPGQMSPVIEFEGEFRSVLLLAATPERMLSASEAYSLIEEWLMEEKLNSAYTEWVKDRFQKATIKISPHLLPGGE